MMNMPEAMKVNLSPNFSVSPNWTLEGDNCVPGDNSSCPTAVITSPALKWGLLALILVIFCTTLGNLLVCLAVCGERRLQNMTNYFLMSLAIADFLVSIIVMPFGMVVEIYGTLSSFINL